MTTISYGPDSPAVRHLAQRDALFAALAERVGEVTFHLHEDRFAALAQTIVGQQLSAKAATTIWNRVRAKVGAVTPQALVAADGAALSAAGLSAAKSSYISGLAAKVADGSLRLDRLDALDDEGVVRALTAVRGIGRWTAEMFLIFSLGRQDVFSLGDAGLRRGLGWLYGQEVVDDASRVSELIDRWQPYRSAVAIYLWEAVDLGLTGPRPRP
jgi:DNA-3-methyladenine glycosylase II